MTATIFYSAYNMQIEVCFKRKFMNLVGDMQSFHCEKFVLWTGLGVLDTVHFVMRET